MNKNHQEESVDSSTVGSDPLEAQLGWVYTGHGEWIQEDTSIGSTSHGNQLHVEQEWIRKWRIRHDDDLRIHHEVKEKGYPNRWGAKIPVKSAWNVQLFRSLLINYEDKEVVEWLQYGWPIGRLPTLEDPAISKKNHRGAMDHPEHLQRYIRKEAKYQAVTWPYKDIPFSGKVGIPALSTRPGSEDRRVILDLSFPVGNAVNDGILANSYMGFPVKLTFSKMDHFAFRIHQLGKGCFMFKIDLSRYFRQIPLDPGDYSMIGYVINGEIYFDKVLPMGMRSAPYIAQRITNSIAYIHRQLHYFLLNYVDDFVGAELQDTIGAAYKALSQLLENLKVKTAKDKIVPPTTRLEFLGITFDSNTMTMEISQEK